nr:hypothetical protein [Tanacetum cinerariifolium]
GSGGGDSGGGSGVTRWWWRMKESGVGDRVDREHEEKQIEEEQAASARYWKIPACCDDDDDYDSAITPILSTEEPIDSLSMGDEPLDNILTTESDEVIKSTVDDLIPIPSEFEGQEASNMSES